MECINKKERNKCAKQASNIYTREKKNIVWIEKNLLALKARPKGAQQEPF